MSIIASITPTAAAESARTPGRPLLGRRALLAVAAVTAVVVAAYPLTLGYSRFVDEIDDLRRLFDLDQEANVPTWWNSILLAAVAFVAALAAALGNDGDRPSRRSLWIVAGGATYFSLDEGAQLHELVHGPAEALLDRAGVSWMTYAWLVFGVLAAATVATLWVRWVRGLPSGLRRRLLAALGLYLLGALGVESVNGWLYDVKTDREGWAEYAYLAGTLVEESLEMVGCIVALGALASLVVYGRADDRLTITRAA